MEVKHMGEVPCMSPLKTEAIPENRQQIRRLLSVDACVQQVMICSVLTSDPA